MPELTTARGSQYTDSHRREAIANYAVLGNVARVAELIDIPERTVNGWSNSEWWVSELAVIRDQQQDEIIAGYGRIVNNAINGQLDRIEHGDYVFDKKGKVIRKQCSLRDLVGATSYAQQSQRLLLNLPTSISGNSSKLTELQSQLEAYQAREKATIDVTP